LGDFRGDVEESDNADISGISDTTNTEQKNEEKKDENSKTDVIESNDNSEKKEPAAVAEDNTESDEPKEQEEEPSDVQFNADPAAAEGVGDPVSINIVFMEAGTPATDASEDVAEVTFTSGVDASGNAIGGEDVAFHVNPNPGWAADPTVDTKIMKENPTTHEMELVALTKSGSAPNYKFSPNGTGAANKTFTGDITITITGARVKHSLYKETDAPTMYLVGTVDENVNPAIGETPGIENIPFDKFNEDAEIKIAIPKTETAVTNKYGKLKVKIDGSDSKSFERNEGTEMITPNGGSEVECVTFTFKPIDLPGYDGSLNTGKAFILDKDVATVAKTLKVNARSEETDSWAALAIASVSMNDVGTAVGTGNKCYTFASDIPDGDDLGNIGNPAGPANKDNYRTTKKTDVDPNTDEDNVLVFNVLPKKGKHVSIESVWAELTIAPNDKKVGEIKASEIAYGTDKKCYAIKFTDIQDEVFTENMAVTIKAETKYKAEDTDEGFYVHNIKFNGDLDTVEIKEAGITTEAGFNNPDKKELENPLTNQDPTFNFTIRPKTGYTISNGTNYNGDSATDAYTANKQVVEISYDKIYTFKKGTLPNQTTHYVKDEEREEKEYILVDVGSSTGILKLKDRDSVAGLAMKKTSLTEGDIPARVKTLAAEKYSDVFADAAAVTGVTDIEYSLKNIEITVKTELVKDRTGIVRVDCPSDMSYDITGTDIVKEDVSVSGNSILPDEKYVIGEDADLLILSIHSEVTPSVYYQSEHSSDDDGGFYVPFNPKSLIKDGDDYTAKIPVGELKLGANGKIDARISITKGAKRLDVNEVFNGDTTDPTPAFTGKLKIEGIDTPFDGAYADKDIEDGRDITVTLTTQAGRLFDEVSYKVGEAEDAEAHEVTVSDDKTTATFQVKMTDKVTVTTKTSATYKYVVTYGDSNKNAIAAGDSVYAIPAGEKKVKIRVFSGSTGLDVETAKIFDGNDTAAAKAQISTGAVSDSDGNDNSKKNTITLTLSEKDSELIRLELKTKKTGKLIELPTISIRQDKAAEEILIADADGNKVESVNIVPGTSTEAYKVSVVNGSLDFMDGNIKMEIARDASKPGSGTFAENDEAQTIKYDNISAIYNKVNKTLMITGEKVKKGNDNPVIVRFYDVQKRKQAKEENKLGLIAGGEISVKLDSPAIADITPEVSAFNTVYNLDLVLSTPGFGAVKAENTKDLYYRINIKESVDLPLASGTDEQQEAAIKEKVRNVATPYSSGNKFANGNKTIYVKKTGESQEILLPVNYQKKNGVYTKAEKTFNLTVDLVHHMDRNAVKDVWEDTGNLIVSQAATLATKTAKATYQSKLTLSATSATVYTGQANQKIAQATFDNGEGVAQLKLDMVDTKTGVSKYNYGLKATAGADGSIYVDAYGMRNWAVKDLPKDLGLKVSAYADEANEVSEIIKLKFVDGVGSIRFENGSTRVLYKQEGKAATMKLKAVFNEDTGIKPKSKTLTYALADTDANGKKLSQNLAANVTVNAKNGTIKVSKNYVHDKDRCTFKVTATAAGMNAKGEVVVTISEEAQNEKLGDIVIVDQTGRVVAKDGGTLRKEDFLTNNSLYVRVLKSNVKQTNTKYSTPNWNNFGGDDYLDGVKITSGSKSTLAVSSTTGKLSMLKSSKKAIKITAENADGSKKTKKTISVNLAGPASLGAVIYDTKGNAVYHPQQGTTYTYSGAMKERFQIYPVMDLSGRNTNWRSVPSDYYKNINIKIKGGKKVTIKNANYFEVIKTAPVTTITFSDKTDKGVAAVTYTIAQDPATPVKGKALKVKAPKLTQQMVDVARNGAAPYDKADEKGTMQLKFQITGKNAKDYAGMFILLTPDYTKTKLVNKIAYTEEYRRAEEYFLVNGTGQRAVKIDADGSFTIPLDMYNKTVQERIPGTYKLVATVGNYYGNGKFQPMDGVKAATVSVKIPGKAPKTLAMPTQADFKLSPSGEAVDFTISSAFKWDIAGSDNLAKNVVNADGTTNNFRKYFKVTKVADDKYTIGMQTENLKVADLDALLKDETGKDLKGYVTVTTKGVNGVAMETRDVLINVTLDRTSVLTAETKEAYSGAEVALKIFGANGKDACAIKGVTLDKSAGAQTGASVKLGDADTSDGNKVKSIKVKIPANAKDTYEVAVKVLTLNSAFANATDAGTNGTTLAEKYGDSVKVTVKVCDPATATDKVEVKTGEDDLAFKALYNKAEYENPALNVNKKWNSYYDTAAKKYVLRVDVKSRIEGAAVNYAAYDKTFMDKAVKNMITVGKGGENEILLTLDRTKFLKEIAASETLEKGATVEIPVTVRFTLSGLKEETITLAVKLPSPASFDEAKASMIAAESELANMQPDEYLESGTSEDNLIEKLRKAFRTAVPLDTDATVSEFAPAKNAEGKLAQKVTIKGAKADDKYEKEFTWDVPDSTMWTASGLVDAIEDKLKIGSADAATWLEEQINALDHNKSAGVTVSNDYTAVSFEKDMLAILAKNKVVPGSNLSITTSVANKVKAKAGFAGSITFTIKVQNSVDKTDSDQINAIVNIPAVTNFGNEADKVITAIDGMDYAQAIYDALADTDVDGLADKLADAIVEKAQSALTNKSIEVVLDEETAAVSGEYKYSATASENYVGKVAFKLPVDGTAGSLRFKMYLKLAGMKDYVIDRTDHANKYVKDSNDDGFVEVTDTATIGKTGKDFQTVNGIATALTGAASGTDKILTTWNDSSDGTAKFVDKVEIKADDSEEAKVKATVENLVKKLVTGMYLDVTATMTAKADGVAKGTVTVSDKEKKRAAVTPANAEAPYDYTFKFEIGLLTPAAAGTESELDDPRLITESEFNTLTPAQLQNGKPKFDRVSGLEVGAPVKVGEHEYRVPLTGTLKYVENWAGFTTDNAKDALRSGYYAMVNIPIPQQLRTIASVAANSDKKFIQVAHKETKEFTGSQIKNQNTFDMIVRVEADTDPTKVKPESVAGGIRGFRVVVDYNSLGTTSANTLVTADVNKTTGGAGDKEFALVTYTFDMSGVTLDNSSEAVIKVLTPAEVTSEVATDTAAGIGGLNAAAFAATGGNENGKSTTVKIKGSLTKQTLTGFDDDVEDNNKGYYAYISVAAPDGVGIKSTAANNGDASGAKIKCYNPNTPVGENNPAYDSSNPNTKVLNIKSDSGDKTKIAKTVLLVRVNDENVTGGKNVITLTVDWDGNFSSGNWSSTTYTLDLSDVNYKAPVVTP